MKSVRSRQTQKSPGAMKRRGFITSRGRDLPLVLLADAGVLGADTVALRASLRAGAGGIGTRTVHLRAHDGAHLVSVRMTTHILAGLGTGRSGGFESVGAGFGGVLAGLGAGFLRVDAGLLGMHARFRGVLTGLHAGTLAMGAGFGGVAMRFGAGAVGLHAGALAVRAGFRRVAMRFGADAVGLRTGRGGRHLRGQRRGRGDERQGQHPVSLHDASSVERGEKEIDRAPPRVDRPWCHLLSCGPGAQG
ncbi:MAG TPA: hypothetical protein VFZ20_14400 [Longimicrobium sp.]|nr:hypothetical protein [Longimicrobium sp.]